MSHAHNPRSWWLEHIRLYQENPVVAHDWEASPVAISGIFPTLLLTTTGRKSGEKRSLPLLYQPCGEGFLIVASKGGADENPFWYENLLANPSCEVVAGKFSCKATARTVTGKQREQYWDLMARFWPSYLQYQARTERKIPLVVLAVDEVRLSC